LRPSDAIKPLVWPEGARWDRQPHSHTRRTPNRLGPDRRGV